MRVLRYVLLAFAAFGTYACTEIKPEADAPATKPEARAAAETRYFFQAYKNNRIYAFSDAKTYQQFIGSGEVIYAVTRIGSGPKGETVVLGLSKAEKDKLEKEKAQPAVEALFDDKLKPEGAFYGELRKEGRIYVFDDWSEMAKVRRSGEAAYAHTEIGAGPKGETVVFVLTKSYVKDHPGKRPEALVALFQQHSGAKK